MDNTKNRTCEITGKTLPDRSLVPLSSLREPVLHLMRQDHPNLNIGGYVSQEVVNKYRYQQVAQMLQDENGEVSRLDKEVIDKLSNMDLMSRNIEPDLEKELTFGQKIADHIAEFGGSWTFILSFLGFMLVWILFNVYVLTTGAFDPFPFILLNLILSCLASLQAPIIMMSQNRQEDKDRIRSEHDYQVNLKAELEIQQLHEKVDHLILKQGQRMLEIQEVQVSLMQQVLEQLSKNDKP
ncbi:hypothetical protein BH09BAC1_BH09BAC1_12790 [soil metagenome]